MKAVQRAWERMKLSERNTLHRISTAIVKQHNRIAVEDLQIGNMVKNPNLARSIAEQSWGRLADQLSYKAASAGGEVLRVAPQHSSTDCHACGHRQAMPLSAREFVCIGCGLVTDRDVNAARNILQRGISLAGWEIDSPSRPGASEDVLPNYVAGLPGQGVERYAGEQANVHPSI